MLDSWIKPAHEQGASDLHLEAGLPPAVRIRGLIRSAGEPVPGKTLLAIGRELLGEENWQRFLDRRSFDLSKTIAGVRCRVNVLQTARGIGFAIRLLTSFQATIESLNLHPGFKKLVSHTHGLVLVSGPTGSGKSSTLAALIQEINLTEPRHILTIESPIEYAFRPRRSYIRQREVGRDTPGFEQALLDALHEDPDVLMVGEMREPETMRLTLNAAETGHLVMSTVHSSSCGEALQRVVAAFPSEIQGSVAAQLADCLLGVICQRLRFRPDLNIRVPECEVLVANTAVKAFVRSRDFFKLPSALETGAEFGMWTFERYRGWLDKRTDWHIAAQSPDAPDTEAPDPGPVSAPLQLATKSVKPEQAAPVRGAAPDLDARIEIEPVEGGMEGLLKKLKEPS